MNEEPKSPVVNREFLDKSWTRPDRGLEALERPGIPGSIGFPHRTASVPSCLGSTTAFPGQPVLPIGVV